MADAICEEIADGKSLRKICEAEGMPNKATVFRWLAAHAAFSDQYARAREAQADTLADDLISLADAAGEDTAVTVARDRLKVDTRKWIASKLKPKVYGDKLTNEHTGEGGGPVVTEVIRRIVRSGD